MSVLADSYIATGQATAFSRGMSPERMAERSAAYADKEKTDQELATRRATEPTKADREKMSEIQTAELQNALSEQEQMLRDNNKRITFDAYDRYDNGGYDVRHINQMLIELSKTGSKMYGDIARVDKLTEADKELMDRAGIHTSLQKEILSNPNASASYVKITKKDGSTSFGDLDVLKGMTGYNDFASNKELGRQKLQREIEVISSLGYPPDKLGLEAFRRTKADLPDADPKSSEFQAAFSEHYDKLTLKDRPSRYENATEIEAYARREIEHLGFEENSPEWNEAFNQAQRDYNTVQRRPAAVRKFETIDETRRILEEDMSFWDLDLTSMSPQERSKIEPHVRIIEELGGAKLDAAAERQLVNIRELTALGGKASELTDKETGILDSIWRTARKYISDRIDGVEAVAAYSAFSNVTLNALYGASLQAGESARFKKQFGSLGQQRGPILAQLSNSVSQLKSNYESILEQNDPIVMAYRTGQTGIQLERVIDALDERIIMIDNIIHDRPIENILNTPTNNRISSTIRSKSRAIMDKLNPNIQTPSNGDN